MAAKLIPPTDPTLKAVDSALEKRQAGQVPRQYLGMSFIGNRCLRKLWFDFRKVGAAPFDAETIKKFDDGHAGEAMQADRLRLVPGINLHTHDDNGEQFGFDDHNGHFSGHIDGVIRGLIQDPSTWYVWEHKQVERDKFLDFSRLLSKCPEWDVLKQWDEVYFAQAQCYMHYAKLKTHYITVSIPGGRDTLSARTAYNPEAAMHEIAKADKVINLNSMPSRISDNPGWWECKELCSYHAVCHGDQPPRKNCRTCVNATPCRDREGGKWTCDKPNWNNVEIPFDVQLKGCDEHVFIPSLIKYGEPVDAGDGWIEYQHKETGAHFINAGQEAIADPDFKDGATNIYSSEELAVAPATLVGDKFVESVKEHFPGATITRVTSEQPELI